jgi:opacity protein-like surface antigen
MLCIVSADLSGAEDLSSSNMVGLRFGFWNAVGAKNVEAGPGEDILTKVTAPYGELHFSVGLKKGFALGVSMGSCYRGETRYNDPDGYYWKKVTIYPLTGELKYYPLHRLKKSRWQPYLSGGIGLISGTENLRFGEYVGPLLLLGSHTNSYLTIGWHAGGGMDLVLSRALVIGVDFKYRGVHFGDKVGGMNDYSGPQAALGVCYMLKGI